MIAFLVCAIMQLWRNSFNLTAQEKNQSVQQWKRTLEDKELLENARIRDGYRSTRLVNPGKGTHTPGHPF